MWNHLLAISILLQDDSTVLYKNSLLTSCGIKIYNFVETLRKFTIAKLSITSSLMKIRAYGSKALS